MPPRINIKDIAILGVIFLILLLIRIVPALNAPVDLDNDPAFHYRMTVNVIQTGSVPAIDRLSTYPQGKDIGQFVPAGMYRECSFFFKLANRFRPTSLRDAILAFCSIWGAMIFLPVFFISLEIYRDKNIAYVSAFLSGIIPAYLDRTFCDSYRYEIMGTTILFLSLLFFIKAFGATNTKRVILYFIASAFTMYFGVFVWRLYILFLAGYAISILYLWLKRDANFKKRAFSFLSIFGLLIILTFLTPALEGKASFQQYGNFIQGAFQICTGALAPMRMSSQFAKLIYINEELGRISPVGLFGNTCLSFSAVFLIICLIVCMANKAKDPRRRILFIFLLFFTVLAMLFNRNKVFLGPLVAISLGETVNFISQQKNIARKGFVVLAVLALFQTIIDTNKLVYARYIYAKMDPELKTALNAINKFTSKNSVMLSCWDYGYDIQTYCNRPTITDGLLESREIVKRIIELSKAYCSYDELVLWDLCKKYDATHLLVTKERIQNYVFLAGTDYRSYKENLSVLSKKHFNLYKLTKLPGEMPHFEYLYETDKFVLYGVKEKW